jgi:hypothetical protein
MQADLALQLDPRDEGDAALLRSFVRLAERTGPSEGAFPTGERAAYLVGLATQKDDPATSGSLVRGLAVLAVFGLTKYVDRGVTDLGVTQVAKELEMSPSTAHRYVRTLITCGFLAQDPHTKKYRLRQTIRIDEDQS